MYSVDTNIFIDWWERRYPPDVFPSVQKAMEGLIASKKLYAPESVKEEISHVGSSNLQKWTKNNKTIFLPHEKEIQEVAAQILFDYPDFIDYTTTDDEADRWIIALAKVKGYVVVTHETPFRSKKKPDRKLYIPDVCYDMKIKRIEFLDLMRQEGWKF